MIISPAKKMERHEDILPYESMPVFMKDAENILQWMRQLSFAQAKELWGCNVAIAERNYTWMQAMDLKANLTPAVLAFEGIQYQYMAPAVFEDTMLAYVQTHLRIVSGFYGVLKPMDGVVPYRLEMQAVAAVGDTRNLYEFWGSRLYHEVMDESRILVNLASKEYSKCVERYLTPEDTMITCLFGELSEDGKKVIQKGTYAKMARGEMVRFMAEKRIEDPVEIQKFNRLGYRFCPEFSGEKKYVFVRDSSKGWKGE